MPPFGPVKRGDLIRAFRQAGFAGPIVGKRHQMMVRGHDRVRIPNPHQGDIGRDLLARILREAGVTRDEWTSL
jgi:predicted RNA binding protein YcfA (HicA-like mRNA interferase family)